MNFRKSRVNSPFKTDKKKANKQISFSFDILKFSGFPLTGTSLVLKEKI